MAGQPGYAEYESEMSLNGLRGPPGTLDIADKTL